MPTCLICDTRYEPSEFPFGAAGEEPCACGSCASADTVREMGTDWFIRKSNEWREVQTADWRERIQWTADDESNDRADHAIDEQGNER